MKIKVAALLLAASVSMIAAPVFGDLDISGSVRIGQDFADFTPLGGFDGEFNVESTSTGTFSSLVVPITQNDGQILDLNNTIAPVGSLFSLMNFLQFNANPNIRFELTFIEPGAFGACNPGSVMCSVNQFNLIDTGNVVANFNVRGNIYSDSVLVSTYVGSFSQSFAGQDIGNILSAVATRGFIDSAFEANFTATPIPEPGSMTLFAIGTGLTAVVSFIRRKVQ